MSIQANRADSADHRATRRGFLIGAALVGGTLLVGATPRGARAGDAAAIGAFGPFIKIAPDGGVTLVSKHSELGQGAYTGLAVILAEEMDADWKTIRVETSPADMKLYGHTAMKIQITGGSSTIANSWMQLRKAGAAARAMFVQAAANRWRVPAAEIEVRDGVVSHPPSKRHAGFGQLLADAAAVTPPADPPLKTPDRFRLVGTEAPRRLDARAKSTGAPIYTQDVDMPGMLVAVVSRPPRFGGKVRAFDDKSARQVSGVVDVMQLPSGVAVVATSAWAAMKGRDALKIDWDDSTAETRSSEQIMADYRAIATGRAAAPWASFVSHGDTAAAFAAAGDVVTCEYAFPYLSHAPMEPMNCVAQVDGKRARLTFGAQTQTIDQNNVAALLGGTADQVEIVTLPAGGSFGRRSCATSDYQLECVAIAAKLGGFRPVKLMRTREDDMRGGYYRPLTHHRVEVKVDAQGYPAAWRHRLVSASLLGGTSLAGMVQNGIDPTVVEGVLGSPYLTATPAVDAQVSSPVSPITVSWVRSVGATHTAMAMEHTIDQLAHRAGIDPVEYRRTLYRKAGADRHLRTLDLAVSRSGWGGALEAGWARGVAVHECFGTVVAVVAEVRLVDGAPKVRRVVLAVDCGLAVTPDIVRSQMEGGVCYGLSHDLFGELKISGGAVETTNFDTYRVLRMDEAPQVEVFIVPSADPPSGVGEPGAPVAGPAVAGALLALTGKPTSVLPFVRA